MTRGRRSAIQTRLITPSANSDQASGRAAADAVPAVTDPIRKTPVRPCAAVEEERPQWGPAMAETRGLERRQLVDPGRRRARRRPRSGHARPRRDQPGSTPRNRAVRAVRGEADAAHAADTRRRRPRWGRTRGPDSPDPVRSCTAGPRLRRRQHHRRHHRHPDPHVPAERAEVGPGAGVHAPHALRGDDPGNECGREQRRDESRATDDEVHRLSLVLGAGSSASPRGGDASSPRTGGR